MAEVRGNGTDQPLEFYFVLMQTVWAGLYGCLLVASCICMLNDPIPWILLLAA